MLKKVQTSRVKVTGGRFAIVASEFNGRYVDSMLRGARAVLGKVRAEKIDVIRVPGAFEITVVAGKLASFQPQRYDAILCLGVIFRGETSHAQHIGEAVSQTLAQLQAQCHVPIIHGVYLFENQEQARVRCLDPKHNRGVEIAQTALAMARVMQSLGE